jgi:hypothetical protein
MNDKTFLWWIHERLRNVHRENDCFDYMYKLRAIIAEMPSDRCTPNMGKPHQSTVALTNYFQSKES